MASMYTVSFEMDAAKAAKIAKLAGVPVETVAFRYVDNWLEDGRHTMFEAKRITIAWPTDWWAIMCKHWGQRGISPKLRDILYETLSNPRNPLPAPPKIRDDSPVRRGRIVTPSSDTRNTIVTALIIPMPYYEALEVEYGAGQISRAVKAIAYYRMLADGVKGLSEPYRMGKFLDEHDIQSKIK